MSESRWEHFHHGADIGVRGYGPTKEAAFTQAALALEGVIADPEMVRAKELVEITCAAPDDELLLVEWLNQIVYEIATRRMLFGRFEVHLVSGGLIGKAWGEPVDVPRHQPAVEVKGATFTELRVFRNSEGVWVAQCVVDV